MVTRLRGWTTEDSWFVSQQEEGIVLLQTWKKHSSSGSRLTCCVVDAGDTFLGVHGPESEDNY